MSMLDWRLLLAAAAAHVCLGCVMEEAEEETTTDEELLINGTPTTARPEVMQLHIGRFNCSATMISPSTFLTAAHCIGFAPIATGGSVTFVDGTTVPVQRIFAQGGGALGSDDM